MCDREAFWNCAFADMKAEADKLIKSFSASTDARRELFVSGVVEQQRLRRSMIEIQRRAHARRKKHVDNPEVWSSTVAYYMFTQGRDVEAKQRVLQWAEEMHQNLQKDKGTTSTEVSESGDVFEANVQYVAPDPCEEAAGGRPLAPGPSFSEEAYHTISAPLFELKDVPPSELQRRLAHGEINPRQEWIPSDDPTNLKEIGMRETIERMEFAEMLLGRGKDKMSNQEVMGACVLFTQALQTLKYYKASEKEFEFDALLNHCYRNKAVTHLKLKEYRQCIGTCEEGLVRYAIDGKLMYLHAKALQGVGALEEAIEEFAAIASNGWLHQQERVAGRTALEKARKEKRAAAVEGARIMQTSMMEAAEDFSFDEVLQRKIDERDRKVCAGQSAVQPTLPEPKTRDIELPCGVDRFIDLLRDITREYTDAETLKVFSRVQYQADYDEKKAIVKLRGVMPEILDKLLIQYSDIVSGQTWGARKKCFDKIQHVMLVSSRVDDGARNVIKYLLLNLRSITLGDCE